MYFVRTPYIIKKLFPSIIWDLPNEKNNIYLTFDDGPHPEITPWILKMLKQYDAKATFFCLGENVRKYPEMLQKIIDEGHGVGSHGYTHLNGWNTDDKEYLEDIKKAQELLFKYTHDEIPNIAQNERKYVRNELVLFRPAFGKIKKSQISNLKSYFINQNTEIKILNWTLMPGDFDQNITSEKCFSNLQRVKSGDIIVLHDNEKSWKHLEYSLPRFLDFCKDKKYSLAEINL